MFKHQVTRYKVITAKKSTSLKFQVLSNDPTFYWKKYHGIGGTASLLPGTAPLALFTPKENCGTCTSAFRWFGQVWLWCSKLT